jgi:predicted TIM-barrel fold metal-dependent hydrolase
MRAIQYSPVSEERAAEIFSAPETKLTRGDVTAFEDFMIDYLATKCAEYGLVFQFHTGNNFAGSVPDSMVRPDLMTDLVRRHSEARFVLMHGGFPFTGQLGDLAKRFPNVFIDISWMPMISQAAAEDAVATFITMAGDHKIVWGGDCVFVEETFGAFRLGVEAVAGGLAKLVESGQIEREDSFEIAQRIFGKNAREIFSLG